MATIRFLGVLLCYNDADILEDALLHLLNNNHDLIVWDHGSDDGTAEVLDKYGPWLAERKFIPRSFDFYQLYQHMSQHLITDYIHRYDWISWPDQDELLEGPDRSKSYAAWVATIFEQGYDYVQFNNFNFWLAAEDDPGILSPVAVTNIRLFNHNDLPGQKLPFHFNLRHYPMRTEEQMIRRINKDRAGLQRGSSNFHYNNMAAGLDRLTVPPGLLHFDNGISDLDPTVKYNWRDIYGYGPVGDPSAGPVKGSSPDLAGPVNPASPTGPANPASPA
jgi:glycosyltransferase involved in cell wall biosynthesis